MLPHLVRDDLCMAPLEQKLVRIETPTWHLEISEKWHNECAETLQQKGKLFLPTGKEVTNLGDFYDGILLHGDKPTQNHGVAAYLRKQKKVTSYQVQERLSAKIKEIFIAEAESINQEGYDAQIEFLRNKYGEHADRILKDLLA